MEFHGPVVCTTGRNNTPTIPCLDFTHPFANNGRLFAHGANMEPIPTPGCTFGLLVPTWKHPHRQRMEENAEPIVQHPTGLHPAAYRFQVRSLRRCAPGSGIGPDAPGLNAQDNGPRVEGRGRIRFRNREAPGWNTPARGPGNQASRALATSTRAANPASSWTAMSARTLRSISTSASFRPWMNWP